MVARGGKRTRAGGHGLEGKLTRWPRKGADGCDSGEGQAQGSTERGGDKQGSRACTDYNSIKTKHYHDSAVREGQGRECE
jgi:hypothetical protein